MKNLLLFIVLTTVVSCNLSDDCGECFTPPRQFNFEFIDLDPKVYTVKLSDEVSVIFDLDMEHISEDCCSYFIVETFNIEAYEYIESTLDGIIQVKI